MTRPLDFSSETPTEPFQSTEKAWFWCIETTETRHSGARLRAGMGRVRRPCEPVDIQNVVLRLARQRVLHPCHLRALGLYGRCQTRPAPNSADAGVWQQAIARLTPPLQQKGIVQ